jgi:hypothetical protein
MGTLLTIPLPLLCSSSHVNHYNMGSVQLLKVSHGASIICRITLDSGQGVQITRKRLHKLFRLLIHVKHELSQVGSLDAISLHVHDWTNTTVSETRQCTASNIWVWLPQPYSPILSYEMYTYCNTSTQILLQSITSVLNIFHQGKYLTKYIVAFVTLV